MQLTNIKSIAKKNNIPLQEIAAKVSISPSVISRYIRGDINPSYERLREICEALRCSASELLGF